MDYYNYDNLIGKFTTQECRGSTALAGMLENIIYIRLYEDNFEINEQNLKLHQSYTLLRTGKISKFTDFSTDHLNVCLKICISESEK